MKAAVALMAIAVFAVLIVDPQPAEAAPLITYVQRVKTVSAGLPDAEVKCPAGRHVVGGGALFSGLSSSLLASYPDASNESWKIAMSVPSSGKLFSIAACIAGSVTVDISTNSVPIPGAGTATTAQPCGGESLLGGGAQWSLVISSMTIHASHFVAGNPNNAWQAIGDNTGGGTPTLTVYAICTPDAIGIHYVNDQQALTPSSTTYERRAFCPGRTAVASAGADIQGTNAASNIGELSPVGGRHPGRSVTASLNAGNDAKASNVQAICAAP